eukprot:COSAG02_NODE_1795_length_10906_cov_5.562084_10_plen_98_part_00
MAAVEVWGEGLAAPTATHAHILVYDRYCAGGMKRRAAAARMRASHGLEHRLWLTSGLQAKAWLIPGESFTHDFYKPSSLARAWMAGKDPQRAPRSHH